MAKAKKPAKPTFEISDDEITPFKNADKFDPQKIGDRLELIRARNGGELLAKDALEDARSPSSPLHKHLEWTDSVAAEKYRLNQVRGIIAVVKIEVGSQGLHRQYVSIRADDGHRSYRSIDDVLDNGRLRELMLEQAKADLESWQNRYRELKELCAMIQPVIDKMARAGRRPGKAPAEENRMGA